MVGMRRPLSTRKYFYIVLLGSYTGYVHIFTSVTLPGSCFTVDFETMSIDRPTGRLLDTGDHACSCNTIGMHGKRMASESDPECRKGRIGFDVGSARDTDQSVYCIHCDCSKDK
jgi:hypothetical protein